MGAIGTCGLAGGTLRGAGIAVYKYIKGVNTTEGRELFQLGDNAGARTNGTKRPCRNWAWKAKQETSEVPGRPPPRRGRHSAELAVLPGVAMCWPWGSARVRVPQLCPAGSTARSTAEHLVFQPRARLAPPGLPRLPAGSGDTSAGLSWHGLAQHICAGRWQEGCSPLRLGDLGGGLGCWGG